RVVALTGGHTGVEVGDHAGRRRVEHRTLDAGGSTDRVVATVAPQDVVAGPSVDEVVARAAVDLVADVVVVASAGVADDEVVTRSAEQSVGVGTAEHDVVARLRPDEVGAGIGA